MVKDDPFKLAEQIANHPDPFLLAGAIANAPEVSSSSSWWGAGRAASPQLWGGDKFPGGFGPTKVFAPNYWELRTRSAQLFKENLYARGLIRRLVTNELSLGLLLEAEPDETILSELNEEAAEEWSENVESRFEIWGNTPALCDYEERRTFAQLQKEARREALVEGDILVILREDRRTRLPKIQLIRGGRVTTPIGERNTKNRIVAGVELDKKGKHLAFHVAKGNGKWDRVPAFGPRSGKRLAWLVYGTDRRMDAVRGEPLLSLVLQSIKELDRYRDSEQRAATVNSILAMFIEKGQPKPGTRPFSGGATRNTQITGTGIDSAPREFNIAEQWPGVVFEELNQGEIPHSFNAKRPNATYPEFEAAIINAIAWANECPPEILTLAFSNNYSASKAAINEFKVYIEAFRDEFGSTFCQPIYVEWLLAETLTGRVATAGLLESFRDPLQYDVFGAWTVSCWGGQVKPSVELLKDIKAFVEANKNNMIPLDRACKDIFGVRFSRVIKRIRKERRQLQDMNEELGITDAAETLEGEEPKDPKTGLTETQLDNVVEFAREEGALDG